MQQLCIPSHCLGIEKDGEVHETLFVGRIDPAVDLRLELSDAASPVGVGHHDLSGTLGIAELEQRFTDPLHVGDEELHVDAVSDDQGVVLVGADDLLPPPFAPHHQQSALATALLGHDHLEEPGEDFVVDLRDQFGDVAGLEPLGVEAPHNRQVAQARLFELLDAAGPLDLDGDQVGVVGEVAQDIDLLQDADQFPLFRYPQPLDVLPDEGQVGVEEKVLFVDGQHRKVRHRPHRRFRVEGPLRQHPLDVAVGDDPVALLPFDDDFAAPHLHRASGRFRQGGLRGDQAGGMPIALAHLDGHPVSHARIELPSFEVFDPLHDIHQIEATEFFAPLEELHEALPVDLVTDQILTHHIVPVAAPLQQGVGVEAVLLPVDPHHRIVFVQDLHLPLDDDIESSRLLTANRQRAFGRVEGDVDLFGKFIEEFVGEFVERMDGAEEGFLVVEAQYISLLLVYWSIGYWGAPSENRKTSVSLFLRLATCDCAVGASGNQYTNISIYQ